MRSRRKAARRWFAHLTRPRFEAHFVEDSLSRRETAEIYPSCEVFRSTRGIAATDACVFETGRRRVPDDHARRAIGSAPDDGAIRSDVAALDAAGDLRALLVRDDDAESGGGGKEPPSVR